MVTPPDRPRPPGKRATAKDAKKDPARPTRAKDSRPELPPMAPPLAELLNPGIAKGTAGPGSQTGLQPPPDNSFDRRADFSAAHRARASTHPGFEEAPQKGYVGKSPLGPLDPDLAKQLGIDDETESESLASPSAGAPKRAGRGG